MSDTKVNVNESLGGIVSEAVLTDGVLKFKARIIEGNVQGSSGYYSRELLERDGPVAFAAKTQMHLDHQSFEQYWEFPAGSLKDLAGFISSTPEYLEAGAAGEGQPEGLYSEVTVISQYAQFVYDLREVIGLSIKAPALSEPYTNPDTNEATEMITKLFPGPVTTVDFVTHPGANGRLLEIVESGKYTLPEGAKMITHNRPVAEAAGDKKEKQRMDEELKKALEALNGRLDQVLPLLTAEAAARDAQAEKDRKALEESEKVDINAVIAEAVDQLADSGLPKAARDRVLESISGGKVKLADAITAEADYIKSITAPVKTEAGAGSVTPFKVETIGSAGDTSKVTEASILDRWKKAV